MKKIYIHCSLIFILAISTLLSQIAYSQSCNTITATYVATESRCAATGTILINASGGSGNYQYKVTGPVNTNYTSSSLITGLTAGRYLVTIKDVIANCIYNNDSVSVPGNYIAPTFSMVSTDVTCINGNDGTITVTGQNFGRAPFSYQIIAPSASGVGTVSTAGIFTGLISGDYYIQLRDSCGAIQTRNTTIQNYDWFINNYSVTKLGCDSISVIINLKDNKGNVTPSPVFNGFLYGASINAGDTTWFTTNTFHYFIANKHVVKLFVKDNCGNIKSVTWTDTLIPKVDAAVLITNKACSTFTATITGQLYLTAPDYCLYDNSNVLLACNTTGVFTSLPYGNYCIKITDNCYDTTITRCFTVARPVPSVDANVKITANCKGFTAIVTGQTNLNNPNYCLYDSADVLLYCNTTGIFEDLPFGRYCIKIFNDPACYDTTIVRCFTVVRPIPSAGPNVIITNLTCSTFTVIVGDTAHLNDPKFCLYTPAHVLIICNTTGIFNNLPYGSYCIDVINAPGCYDTTITICFTVAPPIPSVGANVSISNKTCTTFKATVTGQGNLTNPQYCIYDNLNVLLGCNTTGVFTNLIFGSYCIRIQNDRNCYDTTIERCFTVSATAANISLTAKKSCATIGTTDLKVTISSGISPFVISLFSPTGTLLQTVTTSSTSYTFSGMPNLPSPQKYKIVMADQCGRMDSVEIAPSISIVNRLITLNTKCPSGIWPNGSADIFVNIVNNIGGDIKPKIIKKDAAPVNINPSSSSGYNFTFLDLGPATYVFDTYIEDCNKHVYDTVTVGIYTYPFLTGSNAYQCDNNSFVVSVQVSGGTGPYMYEIIGSVPASPSIVSPPQTSPVFTINNGTMYSLVRLRTVDACGNAGLYDVSVLPLGNFIVSTDSLECFYNSLTLRVDSIANADYTWYKRIVPNDSIIVGAGHTYTIPYLLPGDTGRYFCKIVINNGCLVKFANYVVTGFCGGVLPNDIQLSGSPMPDGNKLYWDADLSGVKKYDLERSTGNNIDYRTIANFNNTGAGFNSFIDKNPGAGYNFYRLKITMSWGSMIKYSNVVALKNGKSNIRAYPNPVENSLFISMSNRISGNYLVEITNLSGQIIMSKQYVNVQNTLIEYPRNAAMKKGIYLLIITDLNTSEKQTFKLVYK